MKYKLSKLVGRNQLPSDAVAFERLAQIFALPAGQQAHVQPLNTQRRQRIALSSGRTKAAA